MNRFRSFPLTPKGALMYFNIAYGLLAIWWIVR
jgi:hypothetical protein